MFRTTNFTGWKRNALLSAKPTDFKPTDLILNEKLYLTIEMVKL